jgi:hypothetical protein
MIIGHLHYTTSIASTSLIDQCPNNSLILPQDKVKDALFLLGSNFHGEMLLPPFQIIVSHSKNLVESKHLKFDQIYMVDNNIYDIN